MRGSSTSAWPRPRRQPHPDDPTRTVFAVFEAERAALIPYRGPFEGSRLQIGTVSKTCLVRFDHNRYSVMARAANLAAAGVGAPHIRQRLFWVAHTDSSQSRRRRLVQSAGDPPRDRGLADAEGARGTAQAGRRVERRAVAHGPDGGLADAESTERRTINRDGRTSRRYVLPAWKKGAVRPGGCGEIGTAFWDDVDLLHCGDGKIRVVEPGTFPLAHGVPDRLGRLRGYGNAIVPQLAAQFVKAYVDAVRELRW